MGMRIRGADEAAGLILRVGQNGPRRVLRELRLAGKRLQNLAIRMAPLDRGNLEHAIKISGDKPAPGAGRERDELGRFTKTEVEVYIDFAADAGGGHTVGEYAWEIHEHMFPYGYIKRGPGTMMKQAMDPAVVVGGGFMERAAEQVERELDAKIQEIADGLDDLF